MAYVTLAELKSQKSIATTVDDTLLTALIGRAQREIERMCKRTFEAATATYRYFERDLISQQKQRVLWLKRDLLTVTSLVNGDGTTIPSGGYWLEPVDAPPFQYVRLKSAYSWSFGTDGEITVTGTWGFSATAPDDIKEATLELAVYLYQLRDSQVFDVTASPELGVMTIPKGFPTHVKSILERGGYIRAVRFA
jgi:hypothetical protein